MDHSDQQTSFLDSQAGPSSASALDTTTGTSTTGTQSSNASGIDDFSGDPYQSKEPHDLMSMDDILAQTHRVGVTFIRDGKGLGFIDHAAEVRDIAAGAKLEVPLWLARVLQSRKLVSLELPKGYNETFREILDADATVVDLSKLGPYYFETGRHLVGMSSREEGQELGVALASTFHQRFHKILDFSLNATTDTAQELSQFASTLDKTEQEMLGLGRLSSAAFKGWEVRSSERNTANDMVTHFNRRKRLQDDESLNNNKRTPSSQMSSSSQQPSTASS